MPYALRPVFGCFTLLTVLWFVGCSNAYRNTFIPADDISLSSHPDSAGVQVVEVAAERSLVQAQRDRFPQATVLGASQFTAEQTPIGSVADAARSVGADTVLTQRTLVETKHETKRIRIPETRRRQTMDGTITTTGYRSVLRPVTIKVYRYDALFLQTPPPEQTPHPEETQPPKEVTANH